ncbi:MAG: leucine-rich repeat domain-containing protein [Lachnospiraceae bacterium]|nr:leucine-rich repeat domain-containing protein [Lachnospiraceae bacterium]
MELTQEEKAARLQQAVINCSVEELLNVYDELGDVEMSAPALGLACRFRGLDVARALVEKGISFDFPSTPEIETRYRCYIGQKYANYRTNYSLYLLKIFRGGLKGACSTKGMKFTQNAKRDAGKPLPLLADDERVRVLDYLMQHKEKLSFQPEEMLFYAIYARDTVIYEALKKRGITLSQRRVQAITEGGAATDGYWYEYGAMTGKLADEDYLEVMPLLASELDGKPFYYTEKMFDITRNRFRDIKVFDYFLAHFRQDKMNKYQMIRGLIDDNVLEAMAIVEREGWLNAPKKRDEMIAYASQKKKTEALAWLLDFKNRTADFAAEQEKAEKKMMRELNAAPDSVYELKKIWSYKKREDNTLMITNYKGKGIEVTVPEKIGRGIVTTIDISAFRGSYAGAYPTWEQINQHRKITKITMPETIHTICWSAFRDMYALTEINIPRKVEEIQKYVFSGCKALQGITIPDAAKKIDEYAFHECKSLKNITIPCTVEKIGAYAFASCDRLEEVCICEGVREIDAYAFKDCSSLKKVTIPGTVERIGKWAFANCSMLKEVHVCEGVLEIGECAFKSCSSLEKIQIPQSVQCLLTGQNNIGITAEVFHGCPRVTVYCPEGSRAEAYCREKGFRFEYDNKL